MSEGGMKYDGEKVRMDLFSARWINGVGKVLTFGAKKYEAHNWRKGIEQSRLLGATLRHIFAYLGGEDYDPETGLLHLYHASCCLMFASEMQETRPDLDDRFKEPTGPIQIPAMTTMKICEHGCVAPLESPSEGVPQKIPGEWLTVLSPTEDGGESEQLAFFPSFTVEGIKNEYSDCLIKPFKKSE